MDKFDLVLPFTQWMFVLALGHSGLAVRLDFDRLV